MDFFQLLYVVIVFVCAISSQLDLHTGSGQIEANKLLYLRNELIGKHINVFEI